MLSNHAELAGALCVPVSSLLGHCLQSLAQPPTPKGHLQQPFTHLQVLAGRIERALQKGLALDELSADKRSLPPDMRWAATTAVASGSGCFEHDLATT